jgi:2',3'-cyclic-nucleotide 2'-phosphodiesterase (5'-nucleotidase family)
MMAHWRARYSHPSATTIALSSGDLWTGQAISTWFRGASTIDVMNAMGYAAAAVGNHELDFGQEVLAERAREAKFPFLSANLLRSDGSALESASPFTIVARAGIRLGIVGLSNLATTRGLVKSSYVEGLAVTGYAQALRDHVPELRRQGVDAVVVLAHECGPELARLAHEVQDLRIAAFLGGHCHERRTDRVGESFIVESGQWFRHSSAVKLAFDAATKRVVHSEVEVVENTDPATVELGPDPDVHAVLEKWRAKAATELGRVIGHTSGGISRPWPLYNLVTDAWLRALPADVAISNPGGFRADIPPGDITVASIVDVLPFENVILELELTGAQILHSLRCCETMAVSGLERRGTRVLLTRTGRPLDPNVTYRVLINDYMHSDTVGLPFKAQAASARSTGVNWRDPIIDWLLTSRTSREAPVERVLDVQPRPGPWTLPPK